MEFVWKMGKLMYNVGPPFIPHPTPVETFALKLFFVEIFVDVKFHLTLNFTS